MTHGTPDGVRGGGLSEDHPSSLVLDSRNHKKKHIRFLVPGSINLVEDDRLTKIPGSSSSYQLEKAST